MINVYLQGTTTFDNNGEATLIPLSCEFIVGINNAWALEMEHPYDKENRYLKLVKDAILRVTGVSFIREWESTDQMVRIYDVKKTLTSVSVIAFPLGMEAQYDAPIEYLFTGKNKTGVQAAAMLDDYVKTHDGNTKYTISSDIATTCENGVEWNNTNLIAAIANGFIDTEKGWGGEVVYDNYKVKILSKIGRYNESNPFPVRYGKNLTGLEHEIDSSDIVTRLYPISSDDLRLNDYTDTTHQSGLTYVDSSLVSSYPFIRCAFVDIPRKLVDTSKDSNDPTAVLTRTETTTMYNKMYEKASALWTDVCNDLTNTRNATYLKTLINGKDGEDGIIQYLQRKFVFSSASFQSLAKSTAKQAVEWIKSEDVPKWEWHENTDVIPHAWWYGDNSVTPAVSYAKNCYVLIGKRWEWFNDDGYWVDYKYIPNEDVEWQEAQDDSGRKWFGYKKGYYAHNEYVYMTVDGQMKEWFYDSDGWYVEDSSGDSNKDWHQDSYGYWFGEEGATADDKSKYIHDRWAFIDGTYYWFDQYGYINADPERSFPDWPWGNQETSEGSLWFGNDSDHGMNAKWLANQWAKIDGEWWYFDSDGYAVDMNNIKSATIAWFADEVYNYSISTVKDCLEDLYEFLYDTMTDYCNTYYAQGLDKPTVNVSVDLIDLSKTAEYAEYAPLEKICLGDNVKVVGRDGLASEARVVGLTYDCIRGYNTKVEIGQLSKTVGQIISNNFKGTDNSSKLVAGDNVIIEQRNNGAQIITVADYTGRTIGLQDFLLNGSTCVSGNVASFGIQAGDNISISRSGNVLTINAVSGGGDVSLYHGIDIPDNSLGDDKDIYLQMESTVGNLLSFDASNSGTSITNYSATETNRKWDITATFVDNWEYHSFNIYLLQNLTVGKKYAISFDFQNDGTPPLYGIGELFGLTLQHSNRFIDMRNWSSDLVENGEFKYFADSNYGEWWYQSFPNDTERVHYEFEFIARQTTEYIGFYGDRTSGNLTCSLYELCVGDKVESNAIKDVFYKINGAWLLYENTDEIAELEDVSLTNLADGEILKYNATTQKWENAEDSGGSEVEANPSGTATDELKKIDIDGTIYDINKSYLIQNAEIYSEDEKQVGVWIDGKPIYQRTYTLSSEITVTNTWDWTSLGISAGNIGFYVRAVAQNTAGTQWCVNCATISGNIALSTGRNNDTIGVKYLTIWYTKTTDAAGSGGYQAYGFTPIIYSTEEREIGVWIDNKPLYEKSYNVNFVVPSGSAWFNTNIDVSFIDNLVNSELRQDIAVWSVLSAVDNNGVLNIVNHGSGSLTVQTITIYYTKTTDVAGSGSYNTLGVPTVHYSTDEQVIGTWFNKPLYQKTITIPNQHVTETMEIDFAQYISNIDLIWADLDHSYIDETLQSTHYYRDFTTWKGLYDSAGATKIIRFMGGVSYESGITYDLVFTVNYTKTTD